MNIACLGATRCARARAGLHIRKLAVRVVEVRCSSVARVGLAEEGWGRGQDAEADREAED